MRLAIRVEQVQLEFPHSAECVKGLCPFETHHLLKKVDENFNLKTLAFSISSAAGWFASAVWQLFIGPKHTYSRTQKDRRIFLRSFWVL